MNSRRTRALVLAPAAVAAGGAAGVWLWRRWGYRVRETVREVAHVPAPPVQDVPDDKADVQDESEGVGAHFHRRYQVDVADTTLTPAQLVAEIARDIQRFVPDEIAVFDKTVGAEGRLAVGDEYHIAIKAPWDGPVRVIDATPTRFTLATLDGHLEAGQIRFQASSHPRQPGALRFRIESWARSADPAVDWFYDTAGVAKAAQQAMWTFFCNRVAQACGGDTMGDVEVLTERQSDDESDDRRQPDA